MPLNSLMETDGDRPNRCAITKSGLYRPVMSSTCAPISTPGEGTAKVLSSKPSDLERSSRTANGVLAGGVVEVQVGDFLALQASAQLFLDERDRGSGLRPVAGREREDVGEALAVSRRGGAEAGRRTEDLVLLELLGQGNGLRRAVEPLQDCAFLLEALVRLHRRRHLVLVVDLEHADLEALDTALAVHEVDVVVIAGAKENADSLRRARAVALQTEDELFVLRLAAPVARPSRRPRSLLCAASSCFSTSSFPPCFVVCPYSIRKWPDPEVVADIAPQPVEALRFDHQKEDDQRSRK